MSEKDVGFISGISGEHNISPENENLSPYLDSLSPDSNGLSPDKNQDLSTISYSSGDNGHTRDKFNILVIGAEKEDRNNVNSRETLSSNKNDLIDFRAPFYYCKKHPDVENIHRDEIEHHLLYSMDHKKTLFILIELTI